jgi:hypothetical protein
MTPRRGRIGNGNAAASHPSCATTQGDAAVERTRRPASTGDRQPPPAAVWPVLAVLARNYPFRAEQAQVGQLDSLAIQVDSDSGSVSICGVTIVKIDTSCPLALADGGFVAQSLGSGGVVVSSDFVATPDQLVDGVMSGFWPDLGRLPTSLKLLRDLQIPIR